MKSIGVIVVTYQAKHHLPYCLPPLLESSLKPRVLVLNSSSNDGTVELAQEMGAETLVIPRHEFNHGLSREKARRYLSTDIVVMITPDAYAINHDMLSYLLEPLLKEKASVSYARQIPHHGAYFFERFARHFNYPSENHIRGLEDKETHGVYTFFCSNSCAAYINADLDLVGGFPSVLTGEDTLVVAKLLEQGKKIAYTADAIVHHSHSYTLKQEFKRSFDTGLARKLNKPLIGLYGRDESRGRAYTLSLFQELIQEKPHFIPYAIIQTLTKYIGYRLGRWSTRAPLFFKRWCSAQDFYWK